MTEYALIEPASRRVVRAGAGKGRGSQVIQGWGMREVEDLLETGIDVKAAVNIQCSRRAHPPRLYRQLTVLPQGRGPAVDLTQD
jgi:hypothetical protein